MDPEWRIACSARSPRAISPRTSCTRMTNCRRSTTLTRQAPVHFLVIPKQHIAPAAALTEDDAALRGATSTPLLRSCAKKLGVDESGYRVVTNVGIDGGQSVKHLHLHVLAKRSLAWPGLMPSAVSTPREIIKRGKPTWQIPIHRICRPGPRTAPSARSMTTWTLLPSSCSAMLN